MTPDVDHVFSVEDDGFNILSNVDVSHPIATVLALY